MILDKIADSFGMPGMRWQLLAPLTLHSRIVSNMVIVAQNKLPNVQPRSCGAKNIPPNIEIAMLSYIFSGTGIPRIVSPLVMVCTNARASASFAASLDASTMRSRA